MSFIAKARKSISFAHLAGIGAKAKAETEEDKDGKPAAESDENPDDEQDKKPADAKAEDDKKQREGESDEDYAARMEEDDEKDKESEASAKSAEDEDGSEEMRGNSPIAKARLREQARCAAIFAHPSAAANTALAANLAFNTRIPRAEALSILGATPAVKAVPAAGRAAGNPRIGASAQGQTNSVQAREARWTEGLIKAAGSRIRK